jgi:hypothetical protein
LSVCTAIKPNGERCKGRAIEGSEWCWNHDPAHKDAHRRHGSRGGKRGGRGRPVAELAALRVENAEIRRRLLADGDDKLSPGVAAVAIQSINTDIRAVATTLRAREQEEIEERIEELERVLQQRKDGNRWGA